MSGKDATNSTQKYLEKKTEIGMERKFSDLVELEQ